MRSYSNGFRQRTHSERAVVLPIVCLLIAGLIGLVAIAVDVGAHFLSLQRRNAVLDLASLSASDLHMRGASEAEVKNHIQYLVNANDSFVAAEPVEWLGNEDLEIEVWEEVNGARVSVRRPTPLRKYFAGFFGQGAEVTSEITSGAAYDLSSSSDEPVHLVLMVESSLHSKSMYGDGCSNGVAGIPCVSEQDETAYCDTGCATRLDVEKEAVRALTRGLTGRDRVSLIDFSSAAKVLAAELIPSATLATEIGSLLNQVQVEEKPFETFVDPAVPLLLAQHLLDESAFEGNSTLVMLTTAQPNFRSEGITSPYGLLADQCKVDIPEGYIWGTGETMGAYLGALSTSYEKWEPGKAQDCTGNTFQACEELQLCWDDMDSRTCQLLLEQCETNPATFVELLAGILAASIQTRHFARLYTINVAHDVGLEDPGIGCWPTSYVPQWTESAINDPARKRNFLAELANDYSRLPYGPLNRLSCSGARPAQMQGRYYEATPSGTAILGIARDLLRHARRPRDRKSEWGDFRSRLIDADEI